MYNLQRAANTLTETSSRSSEGHGDHAHSSFEHEKSNSTSKERIRALANWDPSYPTEKVDWYSEYVTRHAPLSMNWLQQPPSHRDQGGGICEVRGMAIFGTDTEPSVGRVVAPLDDGSICLWNSSTPDNALSGRQGSIIGRSKAGLLTFNGQKLPSKHNPTCTRAKLTSTGAVECVSVDSFRRTAYFAVESSLSEVDLETLKVISHERYPFSISALSEITYPLPLTVGTTLSLHLHDPRLGQNTRSPLHPSDYVDQIATFPTAPKAPKDDFHRLLSGDYHRSMPAPLFQPGPLSILHLNSVSDNPCQQGEIFVAGRKRQRISDF